MNPILAREIRARWRDGKNFLLVLGLGAILAGLTLWLYKQRLDEINGPPRYMYMYWPRKPPPPDLASSMADIGRYLFQWLTMLQIGGWLLIGPAIAAPSIAGERERGLLESLWMSQLRPVSVLLGRLGACLGFMILLQIMTLPFMSFCLILGGVSPKEILVSQGMQFLTGLAAVSLGLCVSARQHRPPGALGSAMGIVVAWSVVAFAGNSWVRSSYIWGTDFWENIWQFIYQIARATHPVSATAVWLDPAGYGTSGYSDFQLPVCAVSLIVITLVSLRMAHTAMLRPLPENSWLGKNPLVERYKATLDAREAERERRKEAATLSDKASKALVVDLPLHLFIRFKDPLLQREVRARFRFRRLPFVLSCARILFLLFVCGYWLITIFWLTDGLQRGGTVTALFYCLWAAGSVAIGLMSASSFSRERESGTWESLRLSLIKPATVVRSKWLSPLWTYTYYAAPFWLLLPLGLSSPDREAPWLEMLLSAGVVVSVLAATSAVGLWVSWRSKTTATATGVILGGLIVWHLAGPVVWGATNMTDRILSCRHYFGYEDEFDVYKQNQSLAAIIDSPQILRTLNNPPTYRYDNDYYGGDYATRRLACILFYSGLCALFLVLLNRSVEAESRDSLLRPKNIPLGLSPPAAPTT